MLIASMTPGKCPIFPKHQYFCSWPAFSSFNQPQKSAYSWFSPDTVITAALEESDEAAAPLFSFTTCSSDI
jgi:hypothetical protein